LADEEDRVRAAYPACLVHNRSQEDGWLSLCLIHP
jgi:hypothetical protein